MKTRSDLTTMQSNYSRREFMAMAAIGATATLAESATSRAAEAPSEKGASRPVNAPLSLDNLATAWLRRRITQSAALPGLNNSLGAVQIEADIAAIKHPVFPPYSAGNEITALTLINGRSLAQVAPWVEIQWRAYAVDRRCDADGWHLESRTSLLPEQPGVVIRVKIHNRRSEARRLRLGFLLSGRAMNSGSQGYSWSVPAIAVGVGNSHRDDGLKQTVRAVPHGSGVCIENEDSNAFTVQTCRPAPNAWERERVPTWSRTLKGGEAFEVTLLLTFHADHDEAQRISAQWYGREEQAMAAAQRTWEALWRAAFTPNNSVFSGHLPVVHTPSAAVAKLYYMGVLTLLTCRREYGWGVTKSAYLTLWPRRGEGSVYLAWDLPYVSGLLARLDPEALRGMLRLLMEAPWLEYQVTNLFSGQHGSRSCCTHPQAITTTCLNLIRWQSDQSWRDWKIKRWPLKFQAAVAANKPVVGQPEVLTGEAAFRQALTVHRTKKIPGTSLLDLGGKGPYLECITTYGHGTAGHSAVQAWALNESSRAFGEDSAAERAAILRDVHTLFRTDKGFFACLYPDGRKVDAANLYDIGLTLNSVGAELPKEWLAGMNRFVREELATPTWAHCLWPGDLDTASGMRADHQWAGCFAAWPAQFLLGSLRAGHYEDWNAQWIDGLSRVTLLGPFAQAYWAEDMADPEAGAAPKSFDDLPQGNHWVNSSGAHFAEMVLDGIAGLQASVSGGLSADTKELPIRQGLRVEGIACSGRNYILDRELRRLS
jgi:hypothetical protein